jgi:hypothetical protein
LTSLSAKPLRFEAAREKEIYKKNLNEAKGKKSLSLFPDSSNQLMTLNKFFLSFGFREKKKEFMAASAEPLRQPYLCAQ